MAEGVAWNFSAGGQSAGVNGSGQFQADSVTRASAHVEAGTPVELDLQLADVSGVMLLSVTANRYDGTVSVQGTGAGSPSIALTGPVVAFGAAVARISDDLTTLTCTVADGEDPADLEILIARDLTD